jgi:hypothetical protein
MTFPDRSVSAEEIFERFKQKMGDAIVYRAIPVTEPSDARSILVTGIAATSVKRGMYRSEQPIASLYQQVINREMTTNPDQDHLLSVSYYPDLAKAIAIMFANPATHKGVAVFKIKIPVVEIVDVGPNGIFQLEIFDGQTRFAGRLQSGEKFDQATDEKIESFVPFFINPTDIVDIQVDMNVPVGQSADVGRRGKTSIEDAK